MRRRAASALLLFLAGVILTGCVSSWQSAPAERPILVLVSIDGWGWDYLDRFDAPVLEGLAARGVRAEGLIPVFPTKTFPNHYTQVTGLRPARHGIVSNNMIDPGIPGRFSLSNREVMADPRWWGGEPIWTTVERQGQIAATMFWPGSDVEIGGHRPSHWHPYDGSVTPAERVDQILEWLALPAPERPTLLTLYFSEVDSAGHDHGPFAAEVQEAATIVDGALGRLVAGVERLGLDHLVHYILVSDHGMSALSPERTIYLDDYVDLETVRVIDWNPILGVEPREGPAEPIYQALHGRHPALAVYRRDELPEAYGLRGHPRLARVIGIADEGWQITSRQDPRYGGGNHGYDARLKVMQGLFIGVGPRFPEGIVVPPFENVHLYELMCAILGVTPAPNDGDPVIARGLLK